MLGNLLGYLTGGLRPGRARPNSKRSRERGRIRARDRAAWNSPELPRLSRLRRAIDQRAWAAGKFAVSNAPSIFPFFAEPRAPDGFEVGADFVSAPQV